MQVPEKRRIEIKKLISENESISVSNLSKLHNVSEITIRRDLKKLEDEGFLEKVHGGAIAKLLKEEYHPIYLDDIKKNRDKKAGIAREASRLISDGDSIIIESGSTCLELVYNLEEKKNLAIFTASVPLAYELWKIALGRKDIEVNICGGLVELKSNTLIGSPAVEFFNNLSVDLAFIGTIAVSVEGGYIAASSQMDADVTKSIINNSRKIVLLADSSKFNNKAYVKAAPLEKINVLITDSGIEKKTAQRLRSMNIVLKIV
ncbi:MAG: DeoR/GlpR transcriptional regulator [Actinobacteria bacterium]|nr:DeoR/GlpR transcriptional regulator [Actinomycetota bacterium]